MPPRETFQDDPLRILRCIRFASRFGFEVVEEVKAAVKDQATQVPYSICTLFYAVLKGFLGCASIESRPRKSWHGNGKDARRYCNKILYTNKFLIAQGQGAIHCVHYS